MILKHKNHLLSEGTGGLFAGWLPILVEEATPQHLANLQWTGERMPLSLWKMVKGFFKWTQDTYGCEAQVRLFYHPEPMGLPRWLAVPYPQTIRSGLSTHELDHHEEFTALQDAILGQGYQPNGSVHHHCTASAFQSGTDFRDEEFQIGIHITLGHLNCVVLSEDTRAVFRGVMYPKLDLQRFIAEALIRLGSQYQNAHDCVCNETAFFLYRFRGLEDYAFADGMPFADQETKTWIQSIAFDSGAASVMVAAEKTVAGHDDDIITTEIAEARAMIRKGKLLQALPGLQAKLNSAPSSREKVLRRQAITDMLLSVNQLRLAFPHLEEIIREIDTYRLEEYEPALAVKGLKLVWLGFESQKDQSFKEKAADALYRIGRLDMAEVVRLDKK